jgi:hypothetical protein
MLTMSETLKNNLLRGAGQISEEIYPVPDDLSEEKKEKEREKAKRRVYNEQDRWPIWSENGILFALRSALLAHAQAKSRQREAEIAAAQLEARQPQSRSPPTPRRRRVARKAAA